MVRLGWEYVNHFAANTELTAFKSDIIT
ncbi:hypothetical protein D046_0486, partial [Vibrio parahaemolyticus V-223/04]